MRSTRRQFLLASAGAATGIPLAASCAPNTTPTWPAPACSPPATGPLTPPALPGSPGLVDEAAFQSRAADYLRFATRTLDPASETNIAAHLIRQRREPAFAWDPAAVTVDSLAGTWQMLDEWRDTGDFRLMYLHWVLALGRGTIDPQVLAAIEQRMVGFRYRWDAPLPADRLDHKWFWSENHRIILAVDEYLAGRAFPDRTFDITGLSGDRHAARARLEILDWIDERAMFGFSEWHSNVYMLKNITPLLTLIELCDDDELIRRCTAALDLCLADIALNLQKGSYGATHGRTYKKDKMSALDESTFGTAKLLFDDTDQDWQSTSDTGATYFCGAERYRVPKVLCSIATSDTVGTVRERHGVPLDPHEPLSLDPQGAFGYDYDLAHIPFWWAQGALSAWQVLPSTLEAANRFRLWDTDLFKDFSAIKPLVDVGPAIGQIAAHELAPMAAFGLLGEAHTYCWRSPEVMLSSVVDHRAGDRRDQVHAWQATIDHDAIVFTTHPTKPPAQSLDWSVDGKPGYWTGTGSMPRTAQHHNVAVHIYSPAYDAPTDPLLGPVFGYLNETHAYFPQDHFDEVVQTGGWTIGRRGDAYIALWSHRPTEWRTYDPTLVATRGLVKPFDLVAGGSAQNVWIVEVARRANAGTFATFVDAIGSADVEVTRPGGADGYGQRARYVSPSQGELVYSASRGLTVDGQQVAVKDHPRLDSPWGEVCHLGKFLTLSDGDSSLVIDFDKGAREVH